MPAIHHGIESTEIYPQPGFSVTRDDNGVFTGRGTYVISKDAVSNPAVVAKLQIGVSLVVLDDDPAKAVYSFLTISKTPLTFTEGDLVYINVEFTGSNVTQFAGGSGVSDAALPRYSLDLQSGELPLISHPKWELLTDEFKKALGLLGSGFYIYDIVNNKLLFPIENAPIDTLTEADETLTGDAIEFAILLQQGETTFLSPSVSWTETTTGTEKLTTAQLNKLAKISTPRGDPPEPNGRNWMLTGGTQDQVGETYQTRLTWNLSGREPFNPFLYGDE